MIVVSITCSLDPARLYSATDPDLYDADYRGGVWLALHPVGEGPTKAAAVADYREKLADMHDAREARRRAA